VGICSIQWKHHAQRAPAGFGHLFELVATSSLMASDGFTRALPTALTVVGYAASFYLPPLKLASIALIVLGVIGLNLAGEGA
jgi:hypothetical protein